MTALDMGHAAIFEVHTQAWKHFTTTMILCFFPIDYLATGNCKEGGIEDQEDQEQIVVIPQVTKPWIFNHLQT